MVEEGLTAPAPLEEGDSPVSALEFVLRHSTPPHLDLDFQRQRSGGNVVFDPKPFLRSTAFGLAFALKIVTNGAV
jgi:hypothetical protein